MVNPLPPFVRRVLILLAAVVVAAPSLAAQRLYRLEVGSAGSIQKFDSKLQLATAVGGTLRVGYWVTSAWAAEVDATISSPHTDTPLKKSVSTSVLSGWVLRNFPLGFRTFLLAKLGYGKLSFGDCPAVTVPGSGPCGSANVWQFGAGARFALSPTLFMRYDAVLQRGSGDLKFSNIGLHGGVSLMLGSKPLLDADGDGVYDRYDQCGETRIGTLVDKRGCPTDHDSDGVPDGLDRCPSTQAGALTDEVGCTRDSDADGFLDGLDQCPDTPVGALVDDTGCPSDSDADGILDGLDRCQLTPTGAVVDPLGCPGDGDADAVFDGLDQCPESPRGATVDATGCPAAGALPPGDSVAVEQVITLPGTVWSFRQATLAEEAFPVLDSLVAVLQGDSSAFAEVNGFAHDRLVPSDNTRLSQRRADAVKAYIVSRGIQVTRVTALGRGSQTLLVSDTTEAARIQNRRVEIRVTHNP